MGLKLKSPANVQFAGLPFLCRFGLFSVFCCLSNGCILALGYCGISCGGCLSLGLCGCEFSFLLGYKLGLSLVLGLLLLKTSLGCKFFLVGHCSLLSIDSGLLLSLPCIKTLLSLFLGESALLDTTLEVLHQEHTLL